MILVFSDYHRHENDVLRIIDRHQPNHILCCGDGESNIEFYDEFGTKKVWIANNETGNANVVLRINYDESFSKTTTARIG